MKKLLSPLFIAALFSSCGPSKNIDKMSQALNNVEKSMVIKMPKASPVQLALDVQYLASDELRGRDTGSEAVT